MDVSQIETQLHTTFEKYTVSYAILFGSYARNSQKKDSDIDIAVFSNSHIDIFELQLEIENTLNQQVDIVDLSQDTSSYVLLQEIAQKGKLIYGRKEDFLEFKHRAFILYNDYLEIFKPMSKNIMANKIRSW